MQTLVNPSGAVTIAVPVADPRPDIASYLLYRHSYLMINLNSELHVLAWNFFCLSRLERVRTGSMAGCVAGTP
jgi:hypothetical protein